MNRQRLILFVLVILLVVAVFWSYTATPRHKVIREPKAVPTQSLKPAAQPAAGSLPPTAADSRILKLYLLEQNQSVFKGYRRNIFKPVFVDELKLVKQKAVAVQAPPPAVVQPKTAPPPVEPVKPAVAVPEAAPLARFTFLGFLKKDGQRTIFLAKDKDIILVKKGDKIAGRYEAATITEQALTLQVSDTGDEIVIPLIENRPLSAAK